MIKTIFLNKNITNSLRLSTNINIILSPEYYWVRVFELPINSKKEVLSVVPNLFEEFFDISGYKFFVQKLEQNRYLCFAYNEDNIVKGLKDANIDHKKINNIYFAQNEFSSINDIIEIKQNKYTYKNEILIQIPPNIASSLQSKTIDINTLELSKHKISLNRTSKYIDSKTTYILSTIFIILSFMVFSKTFILNNIINQYPNKIEQLKTQNHLMSSMVQTKSILKQYTKTSKRYDKLRDTLEYISNFKNHTNGILDKIEFSNSTFSAYFKDSKKASLQRYFRKKYKNAMLNKYGSVVKVEIKI